MSLRYTKRILDHLKHEHYDPGTVERLGADLNIPEAELPAFREAVEHLAKQGALVLDGSGRVRLPSMGDEVTGVFRKTARGFGFIVTDIAYREGDLFVPADGVLINTWSETAPAFRSKRIWLIRP